MAPKPWNWQLKEWPQFSYDTNVVQRLESKFQQGTGLILGAFRHVDGNERNQLIVEIMSDEALNTSQIEGEYLNRDSIQASIMRNLGLEVDARKIPPEEYGISEMMVDLYKNYDVTLSHELLFNWHRMVTNGRRDLEAIGKYREHDDAMQIISGQIGKPRVHYEAPPSQTMPQEMEQFIRWFNSIHDEKSLFLPLARAGIAHLYFVSIHPFEDGNGRIGRALAEKSLAMSIKHPALLSLSQTIQQHKKAYYTALEEHNNTLDVTEWLQYFAHTVLDAQQHTLELVDFIITKAKFFERHNRNINPRQRKALLRMFSAGYTGFKGGLSAENYISITQASPSSATRDLQDMVKKGILKRTGQRKGTRYWLNLKDMHPD